MQDFMDHLVSSFKALADPNRVRILALLIAGGELCVCDIERVLAIPQARVSRHLSILRHAGLVTARRNGPWMHYRPLCPDALTRSIFRHLRTQVDTDPILARDQQSLRDRTAPCPLPS